MRIVSGKYRGKILSSPVTTNIRPTTDKVKQAIFTKLQFFVAEKRVLDLFCGSGALGIEAISRGASETIFVDKSLDSVKLTQKNLKSIGENAKVINADYKIALNSFKQPFDLILLDPPYASGVYEDCLNFIAQHNLLNDDGIIVCERDKMLTLRSDKFKLFDTKIYGTIAVDYFTKWLILFW